jgi:hypothetical protein
MSTALFDAIDRYGLTEQQQNAVEEQTASASMEEINYRVGGLVSLVGAGRLLTTTLPTWPCSCCFIQVLSTFHSANF